MLDAGLLVVRLWGPRPMYGSPGRGLPQAELTDGTFHSISYYHRVSRTADRGPWRGYVRWHDPFRYIMFPHNIMSAELQQELQKGWKERAATQEAAERKKVSNFDRQAGDVGEWHLHDGHWAIAVSGSQSGDIVPVHRHSDGTKSMHRLGARLAGTGNLYEDAGESTTTKRTD